MAHPEIEAFVRRHGLPPAAAGLLQELLERLAGGPIGALSTRTFDPSEGDAPGTAEHPLLAGSDRYEDLGLIGFGGHGEVRRVRDRALHRTVAMKIVRPEVLDHPGSLSRFLEEARVGAQLQHPGVAPVHDFGALPDGRFWFTMREIGGRTLAQAIALVHEASPGSEWQVGPSGLTFHRLIDAFGRVCETVAYAHGRGVLHRDLKPSNVVLGTHGEVLVVDWGLAKVVGAASPELEEVTSSRTDPALHTRAGKVAGTAAYMAPEQARGEVDRIDRRADVYALGAVLYEILSGRPPYEGRDAWTVVRQVVAGPPPPPGRIAPTSAATVSLHPEGPAPAGADGPPLPRELLELCDAAMARDPDRRPSDAGEVARAVVGWLEGTERRAQALAHVARCREREERARGDLDRAARFRSEAEEALAGIPLDADEEHKLAAWSRVEEAERLEQDADRAGVEGRRELELALRLAPDLAEAHGLLADSYGRELERAERDADPRVAARAAVMLRAHLAEAPAELRVRWESRLAEHAFLTLHTDPPGARVELFRWVNHYGRLVAAFEADLGETPLVRVPIATGSWLCEISHGSVRVRYPIRVARDGHWDGVPPGAREPVPIVLPREPLDRADLLVPAGWFLYSRDPEQEPAPVWVESFVAKRWVVTNAEYRDFLDDLPAVERVRVEPLSPFDPARAGHPVTGVTADAAEAYARWLSGRTGQAWRLPQPAEWQKAARGVDGRAWPWGNRFDHAWCRARTVEVVGPRTIPAPTLAAVDTSPIDESVYGVRGVAGNAHQWTARELVVQRQRVLVAQPARAGDDGERAVCGGSVWAAPSYSRCDARWQASRRHMDESIGFRLVRTWP